MLVKIGHNLMVAGVKHGKCLTEIVFWDCDTNHFISSHQNLSSCCFLYACGLACFDSIAHWLCIFSFCSSFSINSETRGGDSALHGGGGWSTRRGKCFRVSPVYSQICEKWKKSSFIVLMNNSCMNRINDSFGQYWGQKYFTQLAVKHSTSVFLLLDFHHL